MGPGSFTSDHFEKQAQTAISVTHVIWHVNGIEHQKDKK